MNVGTNILGVIGKELKKWLADMKTVLPAKVPVAARTIEFEDWSTATENLMLKIELACMNLG